MKRILLNSSAPHWNQALPLGNGRLGAMIFGGAMCDRIQLNEDTLWSGQPETKRLIHDHDKLTNIRKLINNGDFINAEQAVKKSMFNVISSTYLPAGEIIVELDQPRAPLAEPENYSRILDIEDAIYNSEFSLDGGNVYKEAFISAKDNVLVYRIKNEIPHQLNIYGLCLLKNTVKAYDNIIEIDGICPTKIDSGWDGRKHVYEYNPDMESIRFRIKLRVETDGLLYCTGNALRIEGSSDTTIYTAIETSFNGYNKMPQSEGKNYISLCENDINNTYNHTYDELKKRHICDYRSLFDRVSLKLGEYNNNPTNERILNAENDLNLTELLFDFGRYLIIACSREGCQPANLQGIWNNNLLPPWLSNYTMNINKQMNYWHVETCNLPECHEPLLKMVRELCQKGNNFGYNGWASWHNSDLWRFNHEATDGVRWGYWIMGGFWTCRHIWEHYLHTQDKKFLEDNIDIFEKAIAFLKDWMIVDKDGYLSTSPSISPENVYNVDDKEISVCEGSAMDMAIIKELFVNTVKACKILGRDTKDYEEIISKLKPVMLDDDGTILEWGRKVDEIELGHRHISQLYLLHPSDQVSEKSEYFDAVKKNLKRRLDNGGGHTGWSNAWIANVFARLKDGEKVYYHIINMFKKSIYPNMLDAHPPFQIDGNFGICAAICEALLQSHNGYIELLPALPSKWDKGEVCGLVARGGHIVNISWENDSYTAEIIPNNNGEIKLYAKNIKSISNNSTDVNYTVDDGILNFNAKAKQVYTIKG